MEVDQDLHNGHADTCTMGILIHPEDPHDKRTLCRHCQQLGPDAATSPGHDDEGLGAPGGTRVGRGDDAVLPDTSYPATGRSFLWEAETVSLYQEQLGLEEWTIRLAEGFDESLDEEAYVRVEPRERVATIFTHPGSRANGKEGVFERLIVHELVHVLLFDLQAAAMDDRPIAEMNRVDLELERVINRLATTISGRQWEPIDPRVRELHEFVDDE